MDVTAGLPVQAAALERPPASTTTRPSGYNVADPLPAVGEHHRQVGEHPGPVIAGKKLGRANDSTAPDIIAGQGNLSRYRHSGRTMIDWAP